MLNFPTAVTVMGKDFPLKFSYWLSRIVRKISDEMKEFMVKKNELLKEYAEKDKDGKPVLTNGRTFVGKENAEVFAEKYNELADIEIDVGFYYLELDLDKGPALTPTEITWLLPLLKEEDASV